MPSCCNQFFTGWVCPVCGLPISFIEHGGSSPVSIGGISTKNVTINQQLIQGDYIEAGAVKGSLTNNYVGMSGTGPDSIDLPLPPPPFDADLPTLPPSEDIDHDLPPPPFDTDLPTPPPPEDSDYHLPPPPNDMNLPASPLPGDTDYPLPPPPPGMDLPLPPNPESTNGIPNIHELAHQKDDEGFEWYLGDDGVNWYRPQGEMVEWTRF